MFHLVVLFLFVPCIWCDNECGTGVNFCDLGMHLLWTKCSLPCEGARKREIMMCCQQNKLTALSRNDCLKICNKTLTDIIEKRPCAQRCGHGTYDSKKICHCQPGYGGQCCETDFDECMSTPCQHGSCKEFVNGYSCICDAGFTGNDCEIDIDECGSSPCDHGICMDQINGYVCTCTKGYTGYNCETDINECSSSPCKHGQCQDQSNGYSCSCITGYAGIHCENIVVQTTQSSTSTTSTVIPTRTRSTPTIITKVLSAAQITLIKSPLIPTTSKIKAISTESSNSTNQKTVETWIVVMITLVVLGVSTVLVSLLWIHYPVLKLKFVNRFRPKVKDSTQLDSGQGNADSKIVEYC